MVDYTKLGIVAQVLGRKVYLYETTDTHAAVITNGYFDAVYPSIRLNPGDIIIAVVDTGGTPYVYVYYVAIGGADVTVYTSATSASAAASVTVADAGLFTANSNVETVLAEILQGLISVQGFLPLRLPHFSAAGVALAVFADGASDVPGYCATAEGMGIRWNNHAAPLGVATKVIIPPDADVTADMTLHVLAAKIGATVGDATKFTVTAFNNVVDAAYDADSNFGGDSGAMVGDDTTKHVQHVTLTLALANLAAYPTALDLTIKPKDGTLGTDDVIMFGWWILYKTKILTS